MTTKKKTQEGTKGKARARARAIIADVRGYDYDTRLAVAQSLADKNTTDTALAAMCAQAEAGAITEAPFGEIEEDFTGKARAVLRTLESGLPDFLLDGMMTAINAAAYHFNLEVWKQFPEDLAPGEDYDGQGYSASALADLFRVGGCFSPDLIPRPTLAEHIAAVLQDEDTPGKIYNGLADAVTDLISRGTVTDRAEVIALALELYAEEKGARDE